MKKILIPTIFLIALLLAATPFFVGMKIKSDAETFIAQINDNTPYTAEWKSYDGGWLSSQGTLNVGLDMPMLANDPNMKAFADSFNADLSVVVNHGPFLKQNGLGWAEWKMALPDVKQLRQYIDWDANKALYEVSGHMSLNGDIYHRESIPVIKSVANPEVSFAFGGYLGTGEVSNGMLTYMGNSGSTEINSALATASIGPMIINMTADDDFEAMFSNGLYNTSGNVVIPNISVHGIQSFELDKFEIKYALDVDEQKQMANMDFSYLIDAIEVEAFKVSDIAIEMALENYSATFHGQYMQFAQEMAYDSTGEPDPLVVQEFMMNALPALLENGPAFSFKNIAFSMPSGSFSSNVKIAVDPVASMPANPADMPFWMDKIYAEAAISADQNLVNYIGNLVLTQQMAAAAATQSFEINEETGEFIESPEKPQMTEAEIAEAVDMQIQQGIGMLEGMGILILDGTTYKSDLKYDHGQTKVNGQDFALPF